ncbi:MAG: signal peptidase II, partial [Clostridiales bacterium]|nr:signal peptidase II [Clostridiales bacterium]
MFNMRSLNFYLIIIGATFILDQAGKYLIIKTMTWGQSVPVFLNVFHITYVRNTGAAFSSLQDQRWLLISVTSLVILIIFS